MLHQASQPSAPTLRVVAALLKARLVDIFMGDWDRHRKQWRWAKLPGNPLWVGFTLEDFVRTAKDLQAQRGESLRRRARCALQSRRVS